MPATYEPIATTTLGSTATTITFSSIPATYTDLRLVLSGSTTATLSLILRFNNISTATYSSTVLQGDGSSANSGRATSVSSINFNWISTMTSAAPILATADVFSYAGSTNKSVLLTSNQDRNGSGFTERGVGLWQNTSTINRLDVITTTSTMAIGFTATLYGIKAA